MRLVILLFFLCAGLVPGRATIHIVAAENFYGGMAQQIGGDQVEVTSILTNPDQDPHLFTVDPKTAAAVEKADIVVISGIDYDPWMTDLAAAHPGRSWRTTIVVADLIHAKSGDNPHIWYKPETITAFAWKLMNVLAYRDPHNSLTYQKRAIDFCNSLKPVYDKIAALKTKFGGTDVLATEPVFGYMADALGFKMHAMDFQNHVMNNVEPTARETEEFEDLLRGKKVKVLFYNGQASDPVASRMQDIARQSGIPVVGVTETEPVNTTYVSWMLAQLDAVEKALAP